MSSSPPPPDSGLPGNTGAPDMNIGCPHCQVWLAVPATEAGQTFACPKCGGHFLVPIPQARTFGGGLGEHPDYHEFTGKKIAAGVCGILLGAFGVHKFILGLNQSGSIMLAVTIGGIILGGCLIVPVLATLAMSAVGVIEGILYMTKSNDDFYETYAVKKKEWF